MIHSGFLFFKAKAGLPLSLGAGETTSLRIDRPA